MTKEEAIQYYKQVTSGKGVDRETPLAVIQRGAIAERIWDDGQFTLGIEYGVLIALVMVFNLKPEDIQ